MAHGAEKPVPKTEYITVTASLYNDVLIQCAVAARRKALLLCGKAGTRKELHMKAVLPQIGVDPESLQYTSLHMYSEEDHTVRAAHTLHPAVRNEGVTKRQYCLCHSTVPSQQDKEE